MKTCFKAQIADSENMRWTFFLLKGQKYQRHIGLNNVSQTHIWNVRMMTRQILMLSTMHLSQAFVLITLALTIIFLKAQSNLKIGLHQLQNKISANWYLINSMLVAR